MHARRRNIEVFWSRQRAVVGNLGPFRASGSIARRPGTQALAIVFAIAGCAGPSSTQGDVATGPHEEALGTESHDGRDGADAKGETYEFSEPVVAGAAGELAGEPVVADAAAHDFDEGHDSEMEDHAGGFEGAGVAEHAELAAVPPTRSPRSRVDKSPAPKGAVKKSKAARRGGGGTGLGKAAPAPGGVRATVKRREAPAVRRRPPPVQAPALKAGRHDDNKQYNRFLSFLAENERDVVYPVNISERLVLRVSDSAGESMPNCKIEVKTLGGKSLAIMTSLADGRSHFFPAHSAQGTAVDFRAMATCDGKVREGQLRRSGKRTTEIRFKTPRTVPERVPVDIAVVLDTTGSMQSQIDRLKRTLQAIHFQLSQLSTKPDVRFALVAYRDRDDDYVTEVTPFTDDVDAFQRVLNRLDADGGGDTPEDLQTALDHAMHRLRWRSNALRLGFIVSDAIPHTDYGQRYNYRDAMSEALKRGIKWSTVGAGGLGRDGEVIFRQIAQYTMGEYVFITASAAGDHAGGAGEASHHVGSNYKTENLDQAILRIVRRELSYLTGEPTDFDYTIVATGTPETPRADVLEPAVTELLRQLADYSSMRLRPRTPLAVVPVTVRGKRYRDVAGYLSDQLTLHASRNASFSLVERDLQAVAAELKLQLSDLVDVEQSVPIGKLMGAELLIVTKLSVRKTAAELFAKLVRVETGEVLSVAKVDLLGGIINGS